MILEFPTFIARSALAPDPGDIDFTIVIAHRGAGIGLWATVTSCEMDLDGSGYKWNYVFVINGEEKISVEVQNLIQMMQRSGKLRDYIHRPEPLSPPTARALGAESATGEYLAFFDNHCLVKPGYFKRAKTNMAAYGMDMLHSTTRYYADHEYCYEYILEPTIRRNFWGAAQDKPYDTENPYRIAVAGHGGFIVRRSVWEEVGGYGPTYLFEGYGGEEMYFDLKMCLLGKTNWIDPQMIHYHWNGARGYDRHFSPEYYRNMMMCAYIIGGDKWLMTVYMSFLRESKSKKVDLFELYVGAQDRGRGAKEILDRQRTMSLDELFEFFKAHNVRY
jgi:glycosyltransferase involved in cell wall biosynthesis